MNILRWQTPFAQWPTLGRFSNLQDEIEHLFGTPFTGVQGGWSPTVDVHEDADHFVVQAELPGMKKEDIDVSFHDDTLTIFGERKGETSSEGSEVYRRERFVGRFQRSISLPSTVAAEKVHAQYKDGVLSITLPKTEESKPKQIAVSVS